MYRAVPTDDPPDTAAVADERPAEIFRGFRPLLLVALVVSACALHVAASAVRRQQRGVAVVLPRAVVGLDASPTPGTASAALAALSLRSLRGRWRLGASPEDGAEHPGHNVTVDDRGRVLGEGGSQEPDWDLVQDQNGTIFSHERRSGGWALDRTRSSVDVLVWRRKGQAEEIWYRERYDFYSEKDVAIAALRLSPHADPCEELEVTCVDGHIVKIEMSAPEKMRGTDVSAFGKMLHLRVLDLSHSKVAGDTASLMNLQHLEVLDLRSTQVGGDIASFGALTSLRTLRIGGPGSEEGLRGDLSGLRGLEALSELDASLAVGVFGDIAELAHLRRLEVLRLGSTQTTGELTALAALPRLRVASLEFTKVIGELRLLAPLSASLEHLDLRGAKLEVELPYDRAVKAPSPFSAEAFASSFGASLDWQSMAIERVGDGGLGWQAGDRLVAVNGERVRSRDEALRELTRVPDDQLPMALSLERGVFGDIAALAPLRALRHLDLGGTAVSGDVAGLRHLAELRHLDLLDTGVEGHARGLSNLKRLRYLNLLGSHVPCPEGCSIWENSHEVFAALHSDASSSLAS